MRSNLIRSVTEVGGRTLAVQPETQIVVWIVACVTSGFVAPGVHTASGKPLRSTHLARFPGAVPMAAADVVALLVDGAIRRVAAAARGRFGVALVDRDGATYCRVVPHAEANTKAIAAMRVRPTAAGLG